MSGTSEPLVSAIVANYNGKGIIGPCIDSLKYIGHPYEAIVVDNASSDGSANYVATCFPQARLIETKENLGFGKACNIGADVARGRYLLLINSDARLISSIEPAIRVLESDLTVGVVGARLMYGDGRLQYSIGRPLGPVRLILGWSGVRLPPPIGSLFERQNERPSTYDMAHMSVPWVSGAFMLVRRAAWMDVGGMTPDYFMYMEDVDLCRKMTEKGYRISYTPKVQAVHLEGGGKPWIGQRALVATAESYRIYLHRYYGKAISGITLSAIGGMFAARAIAECLKGCMAHRALAKEKARGYLAATVTVVGLNKTTRHSTRKSPESAN